MVITMKQKIFFLLPILVTLSTSSAVQADESFFSWLIDFSRKKEVAQVKNEDYNEECGACHFPFQPGLLPERSWRKLLDANQLADHFGDSAELDEALRLKLLNFAVQNSADKSYYKRSRKIMAFLDDDEIPLRITDTVFFKDKHKEIPDKLISKNPEVNSLSFCDNCHKLANEGIYDDDTVLIPGHGRW
jgi:hypothetical protein